MGLKAGKVLKGLSGLNERLVYDDQSEGNILRACLPFNLRAPPAMSFNQSQSSHRAVINLQEYVVAPMTNEDIIGMAQYTGTHSFPIKLPRIVVRASNRWQNPELRGIC